jgi:hypothetical protein
LSSESGASLRAVYHTAAVSAAVGSSSDARSAVVKK